MNFFSSKFFVNSRMFAKVERIIQYNNIFSLIAFKFNTLTISPFICLLLILSIGISHGSLDNVKGRKLFQIFEIKKFYIFYLAYILIAIIVIILWIMMPYVSLIIFLMVASYHFGKEDTQFLIVENSYYNQFLFLLKGSLIVFAPMYFHFEETISIFKLLFIENENFYNFLDLIESKKILLYCIILSTLANILLFTKNFELKKFTIFLDYFSIIIINYYFSPLVAFTIYFCFLHSVRHSISLMSELDRDDLGNGFKIFVKKALPLTIITAIFCAIGLYLLNNTYNLESSILKIIFIGLASLTFPHILLEYLIEKNEK